MKKSNLNNNEIIILSVVIGVFIALIIGYVFPQGYDIDRGIKVYGRSEYYSEFNYLLALGSLIIVSGISYLCFLKKRKISDKNMIDEPKKTIDEPEEIDSYSIN